MRRCNALRYKSTVMSGALVIRIGFWGPLYYNYNKEPHNSIGN